MQQRPLHFHLFLAVFMAAFFPGEVVAAIAFEADVAATSLRAANALHLEGPMGAFLQEQLGPEDGGASPGFRLEAAALRVETDSVDPILHAGVDVIIPGAVFPTTTTENYTTAIVIGTANQESYRWQVFATDSANPPRVGVSAGCAEVQPSQRASLARTPFVNLQRPGVEVPSANLLEWGCVGGGTVTVKGDFRLSLWAWNATLTVPGATKEIHSGREQSNQAPAGAPDATMVASRDSEVYLFAKNATLTVPALTGTGYTLMTGLGTILSATDVALEGVAGRLDVQGRSLDIEGSALSLRGETTTILSGTDVSKPFSVDLSGTPDQVTLDGQAIAVPTTAPKAWASWTMPLVVGAAFLLLPLAVGRLVAIIAYRIHAPLAGPAQGMRHRAALGYSLLSTFQIDAGRPRLARFLAWRAIRALPTSAEGRLAHAEAARRLLAHRAALRDHRILDDLLADGRQRAINACHAASALCQLDRPDEAVAWLHTAAEQDPALAVEQAALPEFDTLGDHPFVRALRLRSHGDPAYIQ